MKEATFFKRCKQLLGDTSTEPWSAENLSGFFQDFRPDGKRLEPLFADIPSGPEVFARLQKVYVATKPKARAINTDAYFIVRNPAKATDKKLAELATAQLNNWRLMGEVLEHDEFLEEMTPLPKVRISRKPEPKYDPNDCDSLDVFIYDVLTDWRCMCLKPICPHASWLREAFYYLNCDYSLAGYVTWPWYRKSSKIHEPYEPYFELWRHGAKLRCKSSKSVTLYGPAK